MLRNDKKAAELSEIEEILLSGRICQLAFAADPAPYIVTLNYGYQENNLYFHSAAKGSKIDLAKRNPQVGFSVSIDLGVIENSQACDWNTRFRSVVGHGELRFLNNLKEKKQALEQIMAHYSEKKFTFPEKILQQTTVYSIAITEITSKQSGHIISD